MGYSAYTQPHTYSAAYSAMPLRIYSDDVLTSSDFKYIINLTYDKETVTGSTAVGLDNQIFTRLNMNTNHDFTLGDTVYFNDTSNNTYSGVYNIMSVPTSSSIVVDFQLGATITGNTSVCKVIKYKMNPDLDNEAKLDISNTIKDFVTQDIEDINDIFDGSNTKFIFNAELGQEFKYTFKFEDNAFINTDVGFHNSSLSASDIDNIPFQIGDQVLIEQDMFEWEYYDNFFSTGDLGFTSQTQTHSFTTGDSITVTGQITEDYYNGITSVRKVIDNYSFTTYKTFSASTPVEGGVIFGVPRPTYNTVATITSIYYDMTLGVVIGTDIPWAGSSVAISGNITFADDRLTTSFNKLDINDLSAYNSHINRLDYTYDAFDKYTIQNRAYSSNNLSTLLVDDTTRKYRIEQETKSWLLVHTYKTGYTTDAVYNFYDSDDNLLSTSRLANTLTGVNDYYVPVGINQLLASSNLTTDSGSALSAITSSVDYYNVAIFSGATQRSNKIEFELNNDCSRFDMYHLMWKDRYGSWLSYPFKYISTDSTEFERKTFYQTEGQWDLSNNTFGYDSTNRGEKSYFGRSRDKIVLNSGWVEEFENTLIKDLLESTSVYVQKPDGTLIGAIIKNKEYEFKKLQSDYLFQYQLEIALSNNETRY